MAKKEKKCDCDNAKCDKCGAPVCPNCGKHKPSRASWTLGSPTVTWPNTWNTTATDSNTWYYTQFIPRTLI